MRPVLVLLASAVLAAGCGDGGERLSGDDLPRAPAALRVSSPAFIDGSRLPRRYTCDGAGEEPRVQAGTVPAGTSELVLVVSDPDAPGGTYVHLTRYGLSPRGDGSVDRGGHEGRNSAGEIGWTAPCPPEGDGAHRYVWSVYALRDPWGSRPALTPARSPGRCAKGCWRAGAPPRATGADGTGARPDHPLRMTDTGLWSATLRSPFQVVLRGVGQ